MEEPLNRNMKSVFTVIDRGQGKSIWVRVGVGYTNRDGSLNLRLDAIPVNGMLQVREWEPVDRRSDAVDAQPRRASRVRASRSPSRASPSSRRASRFWRRSATRGPQELSVELPSPLCSRPTRRPTFR
jgi:hypothetical protein